MKKEKGFSIVEVVLCVVIVALIGVVGWYALSKRNNQNTPETSSTSTNNPAPATTTEDPNKGYLVVKEWGVRLKEGENSQNAQYVIKDDHTLWLTTQKYMDDLGCKADGSTGQFIRGKAGYDYSGSGAKIENYTYSYNDEQGKKVTVNPVKVGDHYYIWQAPQAPCAAPTSANTPMLNAYTKALSEMAYSVEASK